MDDTMLRLEVLRRSPVDDPILHISEEPWPDVLRGRPGIAGQLLVWFPQEVQPRRIEVIDGVVKASLEELMRAVMVRAVPPKWSGSCAGLVEHGDALAELTGTLMLNMAHVADPLSVKH